MRARGLLVFCLGLAFVAALAAAFFRIRPMERVRPNPAWVATPG